ncbi:MAG: HipA N-terminal domain-containing protein [Muribaculaceae bacterium]|nr:HipA N-terminal domain-containing protein [Muribaculaceae bacterium]
MRQCKVFINKKYAGIMTENDNPREYVFKYDANYLLTESEPVCIAMPLRAEEYRSPFLFPFFANLLSEGSNRELQASYLHIDKEDDFGILLETAQYDTVGIVTVMPI